MKTIETKRVIFTLEDVQNAMAEYARNKGVLEGHESLVFSMQDDLTVSKDSGIEVHFMGSNKTVDY